jgi:1-deoxy-D-xylulose-5-phosphate reductoisomerase
LAWETLQGPPGATVVLNAANEVAVAAFLDRQIRFDQIHAVNTSTLNQLAFATPTELAALLDLDCEARTMARACCRGLQP